MPGPDPAPADFCVAVSARARLRAYLVVVTAGGLAVTGGSLGHGLALGPHPWVALLLCALLVVSELWPIPVPRGEASTDEITLSSTFGLATLFVAPLWLVLVAQAVALTVDTVGRRRDPLKLPFNIGQYALSYALADLVFRHLPAHESAVRPLWALAAGLAFFVVNNGLIAGVLALSAGRSVVRQFLADVRWQVVFAVPATALAPVVATVAQDGPVLLLFVLTPLLAVYRSGLLASRREHEALHDPLTGLGNRAMLFGALDRMLEPGECGAYAVLLVDLDHFKDVNDTLGHHVGDTLLVNTAGVLAALTPKDGLVARLGGDEFAIVLRGADRETAQELGEAVVRELRQPRQVEGMALRVRGSVGIALYPDDGVARAEVLRRADVALYRAKETRDGVAAYRPGTDCEAQGQLALANDLAAVLEDPASADEQLFLAYQPLVSATDGTLEGVECLVRWAHPRLGTLSPAVFLPLAEHAGLIAALGRHVLDVAVRQQLTWAREGLDVRVSVNASVPELSDTEFPETVARTLARHGVAPHRLTLEVTENSLISDPARSAEILRRIRSTGVHMSIDDYGSGYSSLAYVKQLEVDELKIDRQFAAGVRDDVTDRIIVQSTIDLAHQLGLRVVAEGIEDLETAAVLRDLGCDVLQGYALGRPGPASDVAAYVPVVPTERPPAAALRVVAG